MLLVQNIKILINSAPKLSGEIIITNSSKFGKALSEIKLPIFPSPQKDL